jgi:hypothetical protein
MFTLNFYTNKTIWFGNLSGYDWNSQIISESPIINGYCDKLHVKRVLQLAHDVYTYRQIANENPNTRYGNWAVKNWYKACESLHRMGESGIVAWAMFLANRGL